MNYCGVHNFLTGNGMPTCSVQFQLEDLLTEKGAPPTFDNSLSYEFSFPPLQPLSSESFPDEFREQKKQMALPKQEPMSSSFMSFELLRNYGVANKRLKIQNESNLSNQESCSMDQQKFSAQDIMKMAASRYIELHTQGHGDASMPMQPLESAFSGLSEGDIKDIELVLLLLDAAEKVSFEQFDHAKQLLFCCRHAIASTEENCVRKVVQLFVGSLQERIEREIRGLPFTGSTRNEEYESLRRMNSNLKLICHDIVPFNQIMQFTAIQSMIEHLSSKSRIHVIDLEPGIGVRWVVLMQALAERKQPVEMLKITALSLVGRTNVEEAKERLVTEAASFSIPFSYDAVLVRDFSEIKEEVFEVEEGEAVAVYCPLLLRTLISRPSTLENLMRVLANYKPCVMLLLEVEANHNSPSFLKRFTDALFHYSVCFDVFETCFEHNEECWQAMDPVMRAGIRDIVAMEGRERTVRNVRLDVWRAFFPRFGMKEVGFSDSSCYQANWVRKKLPHGNHCTIDKNGKALLVGWKGSSLHSISAWTFLQK